MVASKLRRIENTRHIIWVVQTDKTIMVNPIIGVIVVFNPLWTDSTFRKGKQIKVMCVGENYFKFVEFTDLKVVKLEMYI